MFFGMYRLKKVLKYLRTAKMDNAVEISTCRKGWKDPVDRVKIRGQR